MAITQYWLFINANVKYFFSRWRQNMTGFLFFFFKERITLFSVKPKKKENREISLRVLRIDKIFISVE